MFRETLRPLSVKGNGSSGDRYNVAPCGSVEDSKTRLEWFVGPDKTMSWDEAKTWIGSLTACGGNWQMPTIEQLATLYDSRFTAGTGFYEYKPSCPITSQFPAYMI
jgi:hypothetical protein